MMSSLDQRILFYKAGTTTWTDYSIQLNDWQNSQTVSLNMVPGDYIYISSWLPFNHKYLKLTTPSGTPRTPYIELNDGATWSPVIDQLDDTAGLARSGILQFTRDRDNGRWGKISNNKRDIPVMSAVTSVVYDAFWTRISFPAGSTSFTLSYIGQCFSTDAELYSEYPALRNTALKSAWESGKSDWSDQHLLAACYIAKELRQKGLIITNDQLLDVSILRSPAVHKTAHIIYSGLGAKNYAAEIAHTQKAFEDAMTMNRFQVDADKDGLKGGNDRLITNRRATRG